MRITVDLDNPTELEVRKSWNRLGEYGDVQGRVSSSGKGVHLKIHGFRGELEDTILPRRRCGDDPKRIMIDMERSKKPPQILFGAKPGSGNYAGEWVNHLDRLLGEFRRRAPVGVRHEVPERYQF